MNEEMYYEAQYAAYDRATAEAEELADHEDYLTEIKRMLDNLKEALESYEKSRFQPLFTGLDAAAAAELISECKQALEALYAPRTDE